MGTIHHSLSTQKLLAEVGAVQISSVQVLKRIPLATIVTLTFMPEEKNL
jgi:hypothetical protein